MARPRASDHDEKRRAILEQSAGLFARLQRSLVGRFAAAVAPCLAPGLDRDVLVKPLTMSLFGMLNWHHLWFRKEGPMTRSGYARLAVALVVDGAAGLAARAGTSRRALAPVPTGVTPGRNR